jgi:DNA polymerase III delta prime subunit
MVYATYGANMLKKKPWIVSAKPTTISEVIFTDDKVKQAFERYAQERSFPNLLLHGRPGTGKTSVSHALCHAAGVDPLDVLRINCSDEKIDAMRDKVKGFAFTMPVGTCKVVQLEEFDHLSLDAQALLRALIDEAPADCRFIATCNYINKVTPPLRSRFQEYQFSAPNVELVFERCIEILEKQGVRYEQEDVVRVIDVAYPDFRKVIQLLEQNSTSGQLVLNGGEGASDWRLELLPLLEAGDFKAARKLVCDKASREELQDTYRFLYDHIGKVKKLKGKEDQAVVLIAQYQYQHSFVADGELQIAALFIELGAL